MIESWCEMICIETLSVDLVGLLNMKIECTPFKKKEMCELCALTIIYEVGQKLTKLNGKKIQNGFVTTTDPYIVGTTMETNANRITGAAR